MDHLLKTKKESKSLKKTGDTKYIYKIELDKACFQNDMAYGDFKDLAKRTAADEVLREKHLILLKIRNIVDIKEDWLVWFITFLIKRPQAVVLSLCHKMRN